MTGPIFSLRLWGLMCPCCEKDEDKSARASLHQFNVLGTAVDWHVGASRQRQVASGIASFFTGKKQHTDTKPPTPCQIRIVDATKDSINYGSPYPELQIKPRPKTEDEASGAAPDAKKGLGGLLKQNSLGYQLDIPLHHIERIDMVDPTMIVIITKDIHAVDEKNSTKEAARISFTSSDDRDAACLDLRVLVEWNKQRQPDIEEDIPADGIRAKAQKAAHFAKRELEMRETKRSREQRKAKLMAGSTGGLKYTAMAMAQQS